MNPHTFERLSDAISKRSATVAANLQPGIPEAEIRKTLDDVGVPGQLDSLVALYGWRDGCKAELSSSLSERSFFPNSDYQFLPFRSALGHYCRIAALSQKFDHIFAAFHRSDDSWLAFDTEPGTKWEVLHLHQIGRAHV